jgi:tetratricopeptide (TPR) repeat protein
MSAIFGNAMRRGHLLVLAACIVLPGLAVAKDPPKTAEPLKKSPIAILNQLAELPGGKEPRLAADELALLKKVQDQFAKPAADDALLTDALLFASGIADATDRKKYREQLDAIEAGARKSIAGTKTVPERGEALMHFLHERPMKVGYDESQSSLAAVLDTGKFNCVSSSALYYLIGARLGLKMSIVSIPGGILAGHAALDLIDGKRRYQVEPTNPDGFDWGTKSKEPGVVILGFVPDRKDGYEVRPNGLAAMIYSNRGSKLCGEPEADRVAAISVLVAALCLEPADRTAANNLLAVFGNWGLELGEAKKFEDAIKVMSFGQSILAAPDALDRNHAAVWARYIESLLGDKRDKDAVATVRRAAKAMPANSDFRRAGEWFERLGSKHMEAEAWEEMLAVVDRGLAVVDATDAKELRTWRSGAFRQWSQAYLEKKDADGSLKVLERAHKLDATDSEVIAGLSFHTQSSLAFLESDKDSAAMAAHFLSLCKKFPKVAAIAEAGTAHASRAVADLVEKEKFADAVGAVQRYAPLLATPEARAEVGSRAYDGWARHLAEKKEWQAAVDKYGEALKAYPKHDRLTNNLRATVGEWAQLAIEANDYTEAARIVRTGLKFLPDDNSLKSMADEYTKRAIKR